MDTKELVRLYPNDEREFHPYVLRRLVEWGKKLSKRIPLSDLSSQDIERWLTKCSDDEFLSYCRGELADYHMEITESLIELAWHRKSNWIQQQQQKEKAKRKNSEYSRELSTVVENFQTHLNHKKHRISFSKDARDLGYDFSYLLPLGDKARYHKIAREWVSAIVPDELSQFITCSHSVSYRLLPCAEYSLIDTVPCLDFGFEVNLAIRSEFWLKPSKVIIDGYEFDQPLVQHPVPIRLEAGMIRRASYIAPLREPHFLGYFPAELSTNDLTLDELGYEFWQTVPCVLIQGLLKGNLEPEGCTIIAAREGRTIYQVENFNEEVIIPDGFAQYLRKIGSWDSLTERGIINGKIATIMQRVMARAKNEQVSQVVTNEESQIIEALVSLGTPKDQAKTAANNILQNYPDVSLEERVKLAIQLLTKEANNRLID